MNIEEIVKKFNEDSNGAVRYFSNNYLENSQNIGTKGLLMMLSNSKSSNALMIIFWGIIFSLWIGFAERVFGEPVKKRA